MSFFVFIIALLCVVRIVFALVFIADGTFPTRDAGAEAFVIALHLALLVVGAILLARSV